MYLHPELSSPKIRNIQATALLQSPYLQCCFVTLQLSQAFPNFPMGHSTANHITHALQETQFLAVLLKSFLEVAYWEESTQLWVALGHCPTRTRLGLGTLCLGRPGWLAP